MASADMTSKEESSRHSPAGGFAEAAPHPALSLLRRLAGRAVAVVTTLLGLLFLTFSMGRLLPADPVLAITGAEVSKEVYDRVYNELGLGQPIWMQFLSYVGKIATGDLGMGMPTCWHRCSLISERASVTRLAKLRVQNLSPHRLMRPTSPPQ